jgi:hypothetical protein
LLRGAVAGHMSSEDLVSLVQPSSVYYAHNSSVVAPSVSA